MNDKATIMNQKQQQQKVMNMTQGSMSINQMNPHPPQQPQPQMVQMNRNYGVWGQPQQFPNPNLNTVAMRPQSSGFSKSLGPRSNWRGKRMNKPNDKRRLEQHKSLISGSGVGGVNVIGVGGSGGGGGGSLNFNNYKPPTLDELQYQNRLKTRKIFPKKKFNKNKSMNLNMSGNSGRSAPFAPRNTTSFLIRAKKSGGIAPLVSPYPVTPAVLPTPILTPSGEVLGDMAKEEWGVDGYGSMKGLIRLRSPGHEMEMNEEEEEDEGGSSESDVEEHVEVERRLDHDLSRFEMICDPNSVNVGGMEYDNVLENRVDDQNTHIAQLDEENLILKERLFLMERELGDLRRRLLSLERRGKQEVYVNEGVVENDSENETESHGEEARSVDNNEEFNGKNNEEDRFVKSKCSDAHIADGFEGAETTEKIVQLHVERKLENEQDGKVTFAAGKTINIIDGGRKEESINDDDESTEANNPEEKIAEMAEDINEKSKYVDVEVKTNDYVDALSHKHVVGGDVCSLEGEIAKYNMVLE